MKTPHRLRPAPQRYPPIVFLLLRELPPVQYNIKYITCKYGLKKVRRARVLKKSGRRAKKGSYIGTGPCSKNRWNFKVLEDSWALMTSQFKTEIREVFNYKFCHLIKDLNLGHWTYYFFKNRFLKLKLILIETLLTFSFPNSIQK